MQARTDANEPALSALERCRHRWTHGIRCSPVHEFGTGGRYYSGHSQIGGTGQVIGFGPLFLSDRESTDSYSQDSACHDGSNVGLRYWSVVSINRDGIAKRVDENR
jgi:hypothetical protein